MSSTQRGGERHRDDYYVTPIPDILAFLSAYHGRYPRLPGPILDPAAGGHGATPASYQEALRECGYPDITTLDVREDSRAQLTADYLTWEPDRAYGTIITNPPFSLAQGFAEKALREAQVVILLQRLNWLGSQKRKPFWEKHPPTAIFVHHKRISFTGGSTDSIEYAHFVWRQPLHPSSGARLWIV